MEKEFEKNESYQDTTATGQTTQGSFIDPNIETEYLNKLRREQNLGLGVLGGIGGAIIGAALWAVVTVATGWQIGYMAIGVGILVGFAVRFLGKGVDMPFSIIGAVFALVGCALGNFLAMYGISAKEFSVGYFEVFGLVDFSVGVDSFISNIRPMDLLFYGIAIYEGFKFAKISPTEEDVLEYAAEKQNA
ncbi:hypothetical protein [Bernardetia sp.]|uniref:hypothetical protein n=1 Tax=Bernardetia sp. TaxID=1937974 RepID=UPI0025C43DC4|nr:hypothetical protein [Bernardetia sp.]